MRGGPISYLSDCIQTFDHVFFSSRIAMVPVIKVHKLIIYLEVCMGNVCTHHRNTGMSKSRALLHDIKILDG